MKKSFLNIFSLVFLLVFTLGSCKKLSDFGDVNINPNGTLTPSTAALLTSAETGLGGFAGAQTRPSLYAQYISETQYTDVSLYNEPKLDFDGIYAGAPYDLVNIIKYINDPAKRKAQEKFGSYNNQIAVSMILKAYMIWTVTDRWGDVPYSQAFKGDSMLNPKYDTQESIYKTLLAELKTAKNMFDAGGIAIGDIIYYKTSSAAPSITVADWSAKWKRLANSLRMLIALRMSKVYPGTGDFAAVEFRSALSDADGYITSNDDNVVVRYPGGAYKNPWYNLFNGRSDFAQSKFLTDMTNAYADTRQNVFGSSTLGFPYGLTRDLAVAFADANPSYSIVLASAQRAENSPVVVLAAANVWLARAEAAERGWTTETAQTLYNTGISTSFSQWGLTMPAGYTAGANVVYGTDNLRKIATQAYLAYYPNGVQGWAEWRRTGYPALTPTPYAANSSKQIPRRYVYGTREYNLNATSVAEAVSRLGTDSQDSRVWWDKP